MSTEKSIGNLIGKPSYLRRISKDAASKLKQGNIDFVAANTPKGMIPGWELRDRLEEQQNKKVPYTYVREKKKKGGHKEKITGDQKFNVLDKGERAVIVEMEEDNEKFVDKAIRSAEILENRDYNVQEVITFLEKPKEVKEKLKEEGLTLIEKSGLEPSDKEVKLKKPDYEKKDSKQVIRKLVESGALEIRDLEDGEEPFLYSSGLWGPGYLMVKGLVSQPHTMKEFCWSLAQEIKDKDFDFITGNVTGGVIPGWQLRNYLEILRGEEMPYIYAEGTRLLEEKLVEGELIGDTENPSIEKGDKALIVEELVNTAGTTTGSAIHVRNQGYKADHAATIFEYKNPLAKERTEEYEIDLTPLTNLPETLDVVEEEELFKPRAVEDYRFFRDSPKEYQEKWDLEPVKEGGTE